MYVYELWRTLMVEIKIEVLMLAELPGSRYII